MGRDVHPMGYCHEVRISTEDASAAAALVSELAGLSRLAPVLVAGELRPLLASLRDRKRTCDNRACPRGGVPFIQKQRHKRGRAFCRASCRAEANRGD